MRSIVALLAPLALSAAAVAAPATAHGATVRGAEYFQCDGPVDCRYGGTNALRVDFAAAPGEANAVTITERDEIRVVDRGAPLRAEGLCTQVDEHEARCPSSHLVRLELGDLDDTADVAGGTETIVLGEDGDDTLATADGVNHVDGGPGRDTIRGGPGADTIAGPAAGAPADDVDGGDGIDMVDLSARTDPLTISLGDFPRIEGAAGGSGDDTILGTDLYYERLVGNDGDDVLRGGGGFDEIVGGNGHDTIDGGRGDDAISVVDRAADTIACGAGRDQLRDLVVVDVVYEMSAWRGADPIDVVARDCDSLVLNGLENEDLELIDPGITMRDGIPYLSNPCRHKSDRKCRGVFRLTTGDGRRTIRGFRSGPPWVRVPRANRLSVYVFVRFHGRRTHATWTAAR